MAMAAGAASVIIRSSAIFWSSLPVFLFVSILLFSFRSAVHVGTQSLTSFLDQDPSIQSLLSRLSSPSTSSVGALPQFQENNNNRHQFEQRNHHSRHRRRTNSFEPPRLGKLYYDEDDSDFGDDVFSVTGPGSFYRNRHRPHSYSPSSRNVSFLYYNSDGSGDLRVKNFRIGSRNPSDTVILFDDEDKDNSNKGVSDQSTLGFSFLGQERFYLDRRDTVSLLYLVCFFSIVYAYAMLGFLLFYSCALGVVFFASTGSLLGKKDGVLHILYHGSKLGIRRLPVLLFLRLSLRDAFTQFFYIIFFSNAEIVKDHNSLLKLFVKFKLMPFILTAPPPSLRFAFSPNRLMFMWTLFDTVIAIGFIIDCWVAIMERNGRSGREVVREGFHLLSIMMTQTIFLKSLETLCCGTFGNQVMTIIGGPAFAMVVQSVFEVYFMVVWLMIYFAARFKAVDMEGRSFGWRELEENFNVVR